MQHEMVSMNGEHRPPGLCPQGEEQGKEIVCHSPDGCEFQVFERAETFGVFCGREAAALAIAEELEAGN